MTNANANNLLSKLCSCVFLLCWMNPFKRMAKKMKEVAGGSSSRHSHHSHDDSQERVPPHDPEIWLSEPHEEQERPHFLLLGQEGLVLPLAVHGTEGFHRDINNFLAPQGCDYQHIKVFDPTFLTKIGMDSKFETIFNAIGWGNFGRLMNEGASFFLLSFWAL